MTVLSTHKVIGKCCRTKGDDENRPQAADSHFDVRDPTYLLSISIADGRM